MRNKIEKKCEMCKNIFHVRPCENKRRFCSKTCSCTFNSQSTRSKKFGKKICENCLNEFEYRITKQTLSGKRFCCNKCKYEFDSKFKTGVKLSEKTKKAIGDFMRGPLNPNRGRKTSAETRLKQSISKRKFIEENGTDIWKGRKHTDDTKQKMKENHADVSGKNNPMFGVSVYDLWIKKYGKEEADRRKIEFVEKERKSSIGKFHTEETKQKIREKRLNYLMNNKNTKNIISKPEKLFLNTLEEIYNVNIKRQFRIKNNVYDGLIENSNIIIESDGRYWHKPGNEEDKKKTKNANDNGFIVFRFENNNAKDVPNNIIKYKNELDKIFDSLE